MSTPRLCTPGYALGEFAEPVAELPELLADPGVAAELTSAAAGFDTYLWSEAGITELMATAVHQAVAASGVPAAEVDLVLLATDSLPRDRSAHRDVAELLAETGLVNATASTVGLMDCATAMVAVGMAASLVRDGSARHVLVVSGDVADLATAGQRVVAGGAAVASDAAAAVLVSATARGWPVLGTAHHHAPELAGDGVPPRRQLAVRVSAYRELFGRLAKGNAVRPDEVGAVLPSNLARNVMGAYLADLGYGPDRIAMDNVGRTGHCLGSDPLITLADRPESGGGPLVLLGAGISHLAATVVAGSTIPAVEE